MNNQLQLPKTILKAEIKAICKRYRIDPKSAQAILNLNFANNPDLLQKILANYPKKDVTRFSDYRKVIKSVKKQVYYNLRRYHKDKQKENRLKKQLKKLAPTSTNNQQISQITKKLLSTHVSTHERFSHYKTFYQTLFNLIDTPQTILDIGCGIHPLSYPFSQQKYSPKTYIAIDKDPSAIEILTLFASHIKSTHLIPVCADIASVKWQDYLKGKGKFDLVFMLKLIPVVNRHSPKLLLKLANVPARQILITASTKAMTRKEDITRREDKVLQKFIKMTDRKIISSFKIENEFGYLLGPTKNNSPIHPTSAKQAKFFP